MELLYILHFMCIILFFVRHNTFGAVVDWCNISRCHAISFIILLKFRRYSFLRRVFNNATSAVGRLSTDSEFEKLKHVFDDLPHIYTSFMRIFSTHICDHIVVYVNIKRLLFVFAV